MSKKKQVEIKAVQEPDSSQCLDMESIVQTMDSPEWKLHFLQGLCPPTRLHDAADSISFAASDIVPQAPDPAGHPVLALETLKVISEKRVEIKEPDINDEGDMALYYTFKDEITVGEIIELTYTKVDFIKAILTHPDAIEEARNLVRFLKASHELMLKKIALAKNMGLKDAAVKFNSADKEICIVEFTGDIDRDAEQLFLVKKITSEAFRAAMRRAFIFDREATKEINLQGKGGAALENSTQSSKGKKHRERAKDVTDQWIAAEFNRHSVPLVKKRREDGKPVYEMKRGGGGGPDRVGRCSKRTVQEWLRKYPNASNPEPISGFHAGMLTDKEKIEKAAERWGKYYQEYAKAFFIWRQTHPNSPRKDFRYVPDKVVHGVEATFEGEVPSCED